MSDLISRTGAIAHFDKVAEELDEQRGDDSWVGNAFKICLLGVVNDLSALPSADRPTGEWIEVDSFESEKHSVTDMRCSLCGKYASMVLPHRTRCVYDYCPNCGARMEGGEEE